jgi:hypothetical protein
VLRSKDWPFALRQRAGVAGIVVPAGWAFSWAYPDDCIRVRSISPSVIPSPNYDPRPLEWAVFNDYPTGTGNKLILTQITPIKINYVGQVTTISQWDPLFVDAVVQTLSVKLGPALKLIAPAINAPGALGAAANADELLAPDDAAMPSSRRPASRNTEREVTRHDRRSHQRRADRQPGARSHRIPGIHRQHLRRHQAGARRAQRLCAEPRRAVAPEGLAVRLQAGGRRRGRRTADRLGLLLDVPGRLHPHPHRDADRRHGVPGAQSDARAVGARQYRRRQIRAHPADADPDQLHRAGDRPDHLGPGLHRDADRHDGGAARPRAQAARDASRSGARGREGGDRERLACAGQRRTSPAAQAPQRG